MVARDGGEDPTTLGREAASALASLAGDPAGLVTACRRLVERQPTCGPVWWVAARVLASPDPASEAWRSGDELARDRTPAELAAAVPDDAAVVVVGSPGQVAAGLRRRGDVRALVVDHGRGGGPRAGALRRSGADAEAVPPSGLGAAATAGDLVLLEASAMGPSGFVAPAGSAAAAAVGRLRGVPVWVVAGVGRVLPGLLWDEVARRVSLREAPWEYDDEVVPLAWVDAVVGPGGLGSAEAAVAGPTCPPVADLAGPPRR